MRAIIYARYSTERQNESSIADQFRVCRQHAEQRGWQVVGEHRDEGISGAAIENRPGLRAALAQAHRGDVLLVMDTTRLSRSQQLGPLAEELKFRGVLVLGIQDGYDSSSRTARMQAGLSGIMSEELRVQIADRTRSSMVMHAMQGQATGGRAYGYREGEAQVVQEAFERWAGGESLKQIVGDFNRRDIASPGSHWKRKTRAKHGRWLVSALHEILSNERYAGRLIYNRSQWIRDPKTWKRTRVERPQSEWIVREIAPLIDDATWRAAQARFRPGAKPARGKYLLSGLLMCTVCGSKLVVMGGGQHRYICGTNHNGGGHACVNALTVPRANVERHVLEPVMSILLDPEAIAAALKDMRATIREQQPAEDPQVLELRRMVAQGLLSPEIAAPAIAEARKRSPQHAAIVLPSERVWRQAVAQMRETLQSDDVCAAREVLRSYLGEIPMRPEGDHYVATIRAEQIWLATGTGSVSRSGSGGAIQIRIPTRRGQ
jgi:DNA invertase Pin-like site-specific DNA recombinase